MNIRRFVLFILLIVASFAFLLYSPNPHISTPRSTVEAIGIYDEARYASGRVRVVYKNGYVPDASTGANKLPFSQYQNTYLYPVKENNEQLGHLAVSGIKYTVIADEPDQKASVASVISELEKDPNVLSVVPDYVFETTAWNVGASTATPNDWNSTTHWYYDMANLPEYWYDQGCPGTGCGGDDNIVVAVIDSGLAFEQYDDTGLYGFTGNIFLGTGIDYTGANFNLWTNSGETPDNGMDDDCNGVIDDYNGIDVFALNLLDFYEDLSSSTCNPTPVDYSGPTSLFRRKPGHPVDTYGHGSFVTGMITGNVDNSNGTVSPAHNVTIMPIAATINIDVAEYSLLFSSDVMTGVFYAAAYGADVINLSIGGFPYDSAINDLFTSIQNDYGVVIVAASGNDSTPSNMQSLSYPAAYDNVISVGSMDVDGTRAAYSNGGPKLDLTAYVGDYTSKPYQQTLGCYPCTYAGAFSSVQNKYSVGTSFAAPQVAAAAALALSWDDTLTPTAVRGILQRATNDVLSTGYDSESGHGVLDFSKLPTVDLSSPKINNFTVYRWKDGDRAWIWVGNPSTTQTAHFKVVVNGITHAYYEIEPSAKIPVKVDGLFDGPVEILSDYDLNVSQKILTAAGKINEQVAIKDSHYGTDFYFPIYRWAGGDKAWLWMANPSASTTANVNITIGGSDFGNVQIAPKAKLSFKSDGTFSGPVKITSDIDIYTTLKSLTNGGMNEFKGIADTETDTTFYYPIYRWKGSDNAWIWVGNPDSSNDANIDVSIAGATMGSYVVPAGENIPIKYNDTFAGPVKITSDRDVFSTMKTRVGNVINEFPGIRPSDLSTDYYFPVYRWTGGDKAWIWIGNPDLVNDASVDVTIADSLKGTYQVPAGENIYVRYEGTFDGPVEIAADRNVFATMKSLVNGSINEFVGIQQ